MAQQPDAFATFDGFDWDAGNAEKCRKHGCSPEDIEFVLRRPLLVAADPAHSQVEVRYAAVGRSPAGRPMKIIFTIRVRDGRTLARPISARYMHAKEIAAYEQALAELQHRRGG